MRVVTSKPGCEDSAFFVRSAFLDMETIRRRVAKIKNTWTPEIAKARAMEGARRRSELESILLLDEICDVSDSEQTCALPRIVPHISLV